MDIINIKDLTFSYVKGKPVLEDINLSIKKGEWISILGHNGSGKSTLSKLIIGLLNANSGDVYVDGLLLNEETVYDIRRKIGIVFQNPDNQFVGVTVEDDIAFGMENLEIERTVMMERIKEFSAKVNMEDYLLKEPQSLSGGQKQRVAIAGILAMDTDIIIFDEATSMLDPKGRDSVLSYIKELNDQGITVLTITHDMKEAVHSDRIIILKNGKIIANGITKDILNDKEVLNSSNLELLVPLKLLFKMDEINYKNQQLEELLWELSLKRVLDIR